MEVAAAISLVGPARAAFIIVIVDGVATLLLVVAEVDVVVAMAVKAARSGDAYRVAERRRWLESASMDGGASRTREGVENAAAAVGAGWFCAIVALLAAGGGGWGCCSMPPLPMIWPVHAAGLKVDGEVGVRCSWYCWLVGLVGQLRL